MDDDRIELICQLCTQIGMILEDASVLAVLNKPGKDLTERVERLCIDREVAKTLANAAQTLCRAYRVTE